jgi:MFS family permease
VLNVLVQPIEASYGLDDLQVSLLQGIAFSIAYLLASPIFGRWVDTSGRRNILLTCLVLWSGFTTLCVFARGFAGLLAARSVVGATEAGLTPAAWSMLSDSFDDKQLGRAMSIYDIGPYVGGGLALLLGGAVVREAETWDVSHAPLLSGAEPWQLTFMIVAAIGLLCALVLLALREPQRRAVAGTDAPVPTR